MPKCSNCGAGVSMSGLCTRCDMNRRLGLPAGCPTIPGEYALGIGDGSADKNLAVHRNLASLLGMQCSRLSFLEEEEDEALDWDGAIRAMEEDR